MAGLCLGLGPEQGGEDTGPDSLNRVRRLPASLSPGENGFQYQDCGGGRSVWAMGITRELVRNEHSWTTPQAYSIGFWIFNDFK